MLDTLIDLVGLTTEFQSEARSRGLTWSDARLIEPAAKVISPDDPGLVLQSRELLERTALEAAVGDCGNLELSYKRVDRLARLFERLALARSSDIPDPFRRVWVASGSDDRTQGVALTCENGEIAVFCPPGARKLSQGAVLDLSYRGFSSSVRFPLKLVDSCLFPGGLMLHLARPDGQGAIGRSQPRYDVRRDASVHRRHLSQKLPCQVLDMSLSGLRMECAERYDAQEILSMSLWLDSADEQPFAFEARVCWSRKTSEESAEHGVEFVDLRAADLHRLQAFLHEYGAQGSRDEQADDGAGAELDAPPQLETLEDSGADQTTDAQDAAPTSHALQTPGALGAAIDFGLATEPDDGGDAGDTGAWRHQSGAIEIGLADEPADEPANADDPATRRSLGDAIDFGLADDRPGPAGFGAIDDDEGDDGDDDDGLILLDD